MQTEKAIAEGIGVEDAFKYYFEAIRNASNYIATGKSMGYFHQMRLLMHEGAVGAVKALRFQKQSNRIDFEIFRFVVDALDYNFAPTYFVKIGLRAAEDWLKIRPRRDDLKDVADGLLQIKAYLLAQEFKRTALVAECDRISSQL
ncbi:hypothetical protein [Mesorhizobium sp. CN2-181]|uniref:hypothetical protein n=1 Tax=Mesorhizobium yinganensis TaxID=3157707 RepID=UPI0032B7393B